MPSSPLHATRVLAARAAAYVKWGLPRRLPRHRMEPMAPCTAQLPSMGMTARSSPLVAPWRQPIEQPCKYLARASAARKTAHRPCRTEGAPTAGSGSGKRRGNPRGRMTIFPFTKRRDYRTRFFSCLSDVPIFCKVFWCPCITSGLLVGNMEGRTFNPIVSWHRLARWPRTAPAPGGPTNSTTRAPSRASFAAQASTARAASCRRSTSRKSRRMSQCRRRTAVPAVRSCRTTVSGT